MSLKRSSIHSKIPAKRQCVFKDNWLKEDNFKKLDAEKKWCKLLKNNEFPIEMKLLSQLWQFLLETILLRECLA